MDSGLVEVRDCIILDVCWHPSGNFVAVVGSDGILRVWERTNNGFNKVFENQRERSLRRVEWNPSGDKLVTAGFDSIGVVYSFCVEKVPVLSLIGTLKGQDSELKTARWSPNGDLIVTCSRDKSIWVWKASDLDFIAVHNEHSADVKDVAFSPDGKVIVSVSFDGTSKVWDPSQEFGALQTFTDHKGTVWSLGFNPENNDFVTVGEDGKAFHYILEGDSYTLSNFLELQAELESLYTVCFTRNCWLIAGSLRKIYVIDEDFENIVQILTVPQTGDINCIKVNPIDDQELAIGNDDGTVSLMRIDI